MIFCIGTHNKLVQTCSQISYFDAVSLGQVAPDWLSCLSTITVTNINGFFVELGTGI